MKVTSLLSINIFFIIALTASEALLVSKAALDILTNFHAKKWQKVDIIHYESDNGTSSKIVNEIASEIPDSISLTLKKSGVKQHWNYQLNISSLLMFDSVQRFKSAMQQIRWNSEPTFRHHHIVYAPNLTSADIISNIQDGFVIDNVAFLMNVTEKSIGLSSSFMFTENKCNQHQIVEINRFNGLRWEGQEFFPRKYKNFLDCDMSQSLAPTLPKGLEKVFEIIGESYNFTITETVPFREFNSTIPIVVEVVPFMMAKNQSLFSTPVYFQKFILVVSNGEPFTQLEKMFMMFDSDVWICIGCFLLLWAGAIQLISAASTKVRNFVVGRNVRWPTMNLLDIFLNGGQVQVPGRNFARFILILLITWSLIIRTCYQSMLFEYLQNDLRRPSVDTIIETQRRNLTLFTPQTTTLLDSWGIHLTADTSCQSIIDCLDIVAEPSNKGVHLTVDASMLFIESQKYRSGQTSLHALEQKVENLYIGVTFEPFNPFFEEFNEKINQMLSSGLFDHWLYSNYKLKNNVVEDIGPQILTMDHLEVAFIACLLPLLLAIIAFLCESIFHRYRVFAACAS